MSENSDDLNRVLSLARKRRYTPREYPKAIVAHAQRVIDWFEKHDMSWDLKRFRQTFLDFGVSRMGFRNFVEKIPPIIYNEDEFAHLLQQMGYDVVSEDERDPITVFVSGDQSWDDTRFINSVLRSLPDESTIVEGGAAGAEEQAAIVADQYELYIVEESARRAAEVRVLFEDNEPDVCIIFDSDPREHKRTMFVVKVAREIGVPVKILSGTKKVDIEEWLEEVLDDAED